MLSNLEAFVAGLSSAKPGSDIVRTRCNFCSDTRETATMYISAVYVLSAAIMVAVTSCSLQNNELIASAAVAECSADNSGICTASIPPSELPEDSNLSCTLPHSPEHATRPYCYVPSHISKEAQSYLRRAHASRLDMSIDNIKRPGAVHELREWFANATAPGTAAAVAEFFQSTEDSTIEGVPVVWAEPKKHDEAAARTADSGGHGQRLLVYLHGGGYIMGSCSHNGLGTAAMTAAVAGLKVLCVDYRLAPEHPFPAGLDDVITVYKHVITELQYKPQHVALLGDSAGGGLCMALLQRLAREGIALPAAVGLFSPWVDLTGSGDSVTTLTAVDPMLQHNLNGKGAARAYVAENDELLTDPLVSPVFGSYDNADQYPPILIQVGLRDSLISGCTMLYRKLRDRGNKQVVFSPYEAMWHVFEVFLHVPEARAANIEMGQFLAAATGSKPVGTSAKQS